MNLARVRDDVRRWGLLRTFYRLLMEALRRWLGLHLAVIICRRAKPDTVPITLPPGIDLRLATRADLLSACEDPGLGLSREFVEGALGKGDHCVAAFAGDRMVAYTWRALSPTPDMPGIWVAIERPGLRYGYNSLTRPEYRGQHLLSLISVFSDQIPIARHCPEVISCVDTDNFASLHANRRHGHRKVGYAGYFLWRGRYYPFRSPGAKRYGFRFFVPDETREGPPSRAVPGATSPT